MDRSERESILGPMGKELASAAVAVGGSEALELLMVPVENGKMDGCWLLVCSGGLAR